MGHRKTKKFFRYLIPTLLVLILIPFTQRDRWERMYSAPVDFSNVRCAIAIKSQDDTCKALLTGFCYDILKAYSQREGFNVDVVLQKKGEDYIDSLKNGIVDMIVLPWIIADTLSDATVSHPVENRFVLACSEDRGSAVRDFNRWMEEFVTTAQYKTMKTRFFTTGSPFRRASEENPVRMAGPYDAIVKKAATSIGWDWRMLAAMIWQESKFRIDVVSRRGAQGLMQMMPATSRKMGCVNPIDPEDCIYTGARYLDRLQKMFEPYAKDISELEKYTLAAYNAGEGRIIDCINFASTQNVDYSMWSNMVEVIPMMREDAVAELDTVKLGKFKGMETIAYVDAVLDIYQAICTICPEPWQPVGREPAKKPED